MVKIIFVHGIGVRLADYTTTFEQVQMTLRRRTRPDAKPPKTRDNTVLAPIT